MLRFGAGLVEGAGEWKSSGAKETCSGRRTANLRGAAAVCSSRSVRIDRPRGGELGLFQISKAIKTTLTYAMLVRLNSPTG